MSGIFLVLNIFTNLVNGLVALGMAAASCHCEAPSNLFIDCLVPRNDRYSVQPGRARRLSGRA